MDLKTLITNFLITLATTSLGSYLSYKQAIKISNNKIEEIKINSETEIKKIREESNREIEKIKVEHQEYRKTRKNDSKINNEEQATNFAMNVVNNLINDPDKAIKQINTLETLEKKFPKKKKKRK